MTHRDHKNDTNNEPLISRLGVIEKMLINVKQGQRDSSTRAKESNGVQQNWNHFAAEFRIPNLRQRNPASGANGAEFMTRRMIQEPAERKRKV